MSDDEYEIPLQDQRIFRAGIKRQRVRFVPSTSTTTTNLATTLADTKSASDIYLSLVLPQDTQKSEDSSKASSLRPNITEPSSKYHVCDVCCLPLSAINSNPSTCLEESAQSERPHEASLAHQVCLEHSHPPSHLDRNRKGLAYLSAYGWDPDSRLGLGAEGQGIQFPIKARPKDDKLGIGVVLPKPGEIQKKIKVKKLDAGKIRKMYEKDKKKGDQLRDMFYRNEDVERYLGGG